METRSGEDVVMRDYSGTQAGQPLATTVEVGIDMMVDGIQELVIEHP